MDRNQIDQLLMVYGSKIPANMYPMVKSRLETMDSNTANVAFMQMKDPTISLLISIFLGGYGIDRMYIGDVGLGVIKLLTCGGCGVWWLVDLFLIMDKTKEKNAQLLLNGGMMGNGFCSVPVNGFMSKLGTGVAHFPVVYYLFLRSWCFISARQSHDTKELKPCR